MKRNGKTTLNFKAIFGVVAGLGITSLATMWLWPEDKSERIIDEFYRADSNRITDSGLYYQFDFRAEKYRYYLYAERDDIKMKYVGDFENVRKAHNAIQNTYNKAYQHVLDSGVETPDSASWLINYDNFTIDDYHRSTHFDITIDPLSGNAVEINKLAESIDSNNTWSIDGKVLKIISPSTNRRHFYEKYLKFYGLEERPQAQLESGILQERPQKELQKAEGALAKQDAQAKQEAAVKVKEALEEKKKVPREKEWAVIDRFFGDGDDYWGHDGLFYEFDFGQETFRFSIIDTKEKPSDRIIFKSRSVAIDLAPPEIKERYKIAHETVNRNIVDDSSGALWIVSDRECDLNNDRPRGKFSQIAIVDPVSRYTIIVNPASDNGVKTRGQLDGVVYAPGNVPAYFHDDCKTQLAAYAAAAGVAPGQGTAKQGSVPVVLTP